MEIEVRPGIVSKDPDSGLMICKPIRSKIISLYTETNELQFAVPGGLIGKGERLLSFGRQSRVKLCIEAAKLASFFISC